MITFWREHCGHSRQFEGHRLPGIVLMSVPIVPPIASFIVWWVQWLECVAYSDDGRGGTPSALLWLQQISPLPQISLYTAI